MKIEKEVQESTRIWNDLYRSFESGKPLGIEYPTEALVRYVANQRKGSSVQEYFADAGREHSIKRGFDGNALEIGFGTVANLKMVREKGYSCHGLEVSKEAVERGRQVLEAEGIRDVELRHWEPGAIPFPDGHFKLVYGLQCIYYNLDLAATVAEIHRVLAPGGKFLFSFFSDRHGYADFLEPVEGKIRRWKMDHPNERLRGGALWQPSSKDDLLELFKDFKNTRVFTTESDQTPIFESWWYAVGDKA